MTVVETVLVFAGIPIGVLLVMAVLTMAPSAVRGQTRYRPGRPWNYDAAWWLPEPAAVGTSPAVHAAIEAESRSVFGEVAAGAAEQADRSGAGAAAAAEVGKRAAAERATAAVGVPAVSGELVRHDGPVADSADAGATWLSYGPVPGAENGRFGFGPRAMSRIDEAMTLSSRETGLTFSVYVGPLTEPTREHAEAMLTRLADDGVEAPVLVAVSPGQRLLQIVTGEIASRRVPNRSCALAALGMRAAFSGGDLAGGIVTGLRMLADAAGAPRA